ncbi:MAG: hypothetical protein J6A89_03265 [Clostridia bacterium]|nr:hypothetical protein [Clostridia bacterium]
MNKEMEQLEMAWWSVKAIKNKVEACTMDIIEMISDIRKFIEDNYRHYEDANGEKQVVQQRIGGVLQQLEELQTEYEICNYENGEVLEASNNHQEENKQLLDEVKSEIITILDSFSNVTQTSEYEELDWDLQNKKTSITNKLDGCYSDISATVESINMLMLEIIESQKQENEVVNEGQTETTESNTKLHNEYINYGVVEQDLQDSRENINLAIREKQNPQRSQINQSVNNKGDRE